MNILAHRGMWGTTEEKNTRDAIKRAVEKGYGFETDIRDYNGRIVISHDIPLEGTLELDSLLKMCMGEKPWVALNVKADGIGKLSQKLLLDNQIENYFFFDMSAPEMYLYIKCGYKVFTRQSEFEKVPLFYDECIGVWLDEFEKEWILGETILHHIRNGKLVSLVSPELHGREISTRWDLYRSIQKKIDYNSRKLLFLCTDYPEKARLFFNEQD